jgi:hypothetical protein
MADSVESPSYINQSGRGNPSLSDNSNSGDEAKAQSSLDKGKRKAGEPDLSSPEKYNTERYATEVHRIEMSLGKTRGSAKMFEPTTNNSMVLPQNWMTLIEENNLWLMAEKCMEILGIRHTLDENPLQLDVSTKNDNSRFIDGLLLSLQEKTISQNNWATTSEIEKGRMEGNVRRAMHLASQNRVPWALMKHQKSGVSAGLNYTDTLYLRLTAMVQTKTHHQKVGMWLTKLYNSAQIKLSRECKQPITDYVLSFDEVWTSIGDTKKDAAGRVKLDKAGNPKRYHPSKPDFNGMERTEVLYLKNNLSELWSSVDALRNLWAACELPSAFGHYAASLRKVYNAQVKSVKAAKALADTRIEALGLPRTAPKAAISNRKAQRIATNDYNPVYGNRELLLISTQANIDVINILSEQNEILGGWTESNPRSEIEGRLAGLLQFKRELNEARPTKAG